MTLTRASEGFAQMLGLGLVMVLVPLIYKGLGKSSGASSWSSSSCPPS